MLTEYLVINAGTNPLLDREHVGAIKAYKDLVDINFDEVTSEEVSND